MIQPDDDLPEEIGAAMTEAGFAPTLPSLKELIANAARTHEHENRAPAAMAAARLDTIERQCRGRKARRRSRAIGRGAYRRQMVCQRFQRGNLVAENRQMVSQRGR